MRIKLFIKLIYFIRPYLSRVLQYSCQFLLLSLVTVLFIQVLFRFVFRHPFPWAEEIGRYLFVWLSILGMVLAVERKAHFKVDFIANRLSSKKQLFLDHSLRIIMSLFLVILIFESINLTIIGNSQFSATLKMPFSYLFIIMPISFSAMCLFLLFFRSEQIEK